MSFKLNPNAIILRLSGLPVDITPLRRIAREIGGLISSVMEDEPKEMSANDYSAKAQTWLIVLREMKKVK